MAIDTKRTRDYLADFAFQELFTEELGWSRSRSSRAVPGALDGTTYTQRPVAELGGVLVLEIEGADGIPDARTRQAIHREIAKHHHENLLIFVDPDRVQSLWYWGKREGTKVYPREHLYVKGQPGDLFLSKLSGMFVDLGDFDEEGNVPVVKVAQRLAASLDVERVTKKFYREFHDQHLAFIEHIRGIDDEGDRRWYASVLLNRLMFIYFLQRKFFLDRGNGNYLQDKLRESQARGRDRFYSEFLKALFFEGFAKPEAQRSAETNRLLGKIRYLNGGLFLPHRIEQQYGDSIHVSDQAFENLLALFGSYSWNLDDTPGGKDDEINPDVLGYIFEKYINQKAFGAYYTRTEITEYLCEQTIHRLILQRVNDPGIPGAAPPRQFDSVPDLLMKLDAQLCRQLLEEVLPGLALLDPACGSGAFLVAGMKTLIDVYSAVTGRIEYVGDARLKDWLQQTRSEHPSLHYYIKKRIIADNLFGVDIMEEATEIARLRLFLALVSSAQSVDQLEPLPNIDFNILAGNSLIGLLHVDEAEYNRRAAQGDLFLKSYRELVNEKNRLVGLYRHYSATEAEDSAGLRELRDAIEKHRRAARETLDALLLDEFVRLGIRFEQATWDLAKNKEGKPQRRALTLKDIRALQPFHWGYEFDEVINGRGGFDAIITNPPWDIFKPNAKEFFEEHSDLVTKNKMTIKEFEKEQGKLLRNPEVSKVWLEYLSRFPHVSAWFRTAKQYENQISFINGKKAGTDINLYKLFTEQCFNLLHAGGECGIVIPSGIYTDLGTKQLREMLFSQTRISGLFGFENRKAIFEGVDSRFKFVVLTFEKGGSTERFPAAFMRHHVEDLSEFPRQGAIAVAVDLVRRLSPDSLSVMEFKSDLDAWIAEKMLRFPLLGQKLNGAWNLALTAEFHMTNDSYLFQNKPGPGRLSLVEGKMIWQFDHHYAEPRYWVEEGQGRKALLRRVPDTGQTLSYQNYRLAIRAVASNTNERSLICALLPPPHFCGNSALTSVDGFQSGARLLFCVAVMNSFTLDWVMRSKVTANINMFYILDFPPADGHGVKQLPSG